jgi:hypothetical protein
LPNIALSRDFSNPFDQPLGHFQAIIRPLLPPCRPGF